MSNLAEIMQFAADDMKGNLAKTRAALSHNLSKGEAAEEAFRRFLRRHLPGSIGIASGQVVDSTGTVSKQLDVILYDVAHTPLLFSSDEENHQLVPSEGVIAAVEVKVTMTPQMVDSVFSNMQSVKSLDKTSFIDTDTVVKHAFNLYGSSYKLMPTMYFLFAFESTDIIKIWEKFEPLQQAAPLDQRLDCACFLDHGMLVNQTADPFQIDALPKPGSMFLPAFVKHPLLLWFLLVSAYLFQARGRPVLLKNYVPKDFSY